MDRLPVTRYGQPVYWILNADGTTSPAETFDAWMECYGEEELRRIGQDTIGDWQVTTEFLGIALDADGPGPPRLWRTTVWRPLPDGGSSQETWKGYASRDAAERGHKTVCRWAQRVHRQLE